MAMSCWLLVIWVALFVGELRSAAGSGSGELHYQLPWAPHAVARSRGCTGTVAECLAAGGSDDDGEEFQLDSEIHRRVLYPTQRFISYGALSRGNVPCSHRGASYYNCQPGALANTYSRGCSTITRCRS